MTTWAPAARAGRPDEGGHGSAAPKGWAGSVAARTIGAALPWPPSSGRPARAAGAHVVMADGRPLAFLERGGRSVVLFPGAAGRSDDAAGPDSATGAEGEVAPDAGWVDALVTLVRSGRRSSIEVTKVDGAPVRETPAADLLRAGGFRESYRGLSLRSR